MSGAPAGGAGGEVNDEFLADVGDDRPKDTGPVHWPVWNREGKGETVMRTLPHPQTGQGAVVLGVLTLTVVAMVVLATAPRADTPVVAGALVGAVAAVFVMTAAVRHARRRAARHARGRLVETVDESWFTARTLEGFPKEAVLARLPGQDSPSPECVYTAWVFATQGYDAVWIAHHLDLPEDVTHLLVEAARHRH
ncbi:hypothetical protein [Streptomyces rugosispiralis]|uniref:Uncharacterized protein n=1 Tax=Streptomyces rugosispiralis TaxID=2967341 RepID=A0ABT1VCD8_9ACTN|nr:hypothetical protein [Streptomyces rugosispiralis]MCQ8195050.1 hypothetical protein [Streptomyces rugosispiralis]